MGADVVAMPGFAPVAPIARVLSRFDRSQIEAFAEVAIALLDLADGDADAEVTAAEDDFHALTGDGPGCPLADPAEVDDEAEEDDPAGQCDEDGINTAFEGRRLHAGPGCPIGDGLEQLP